MTEEFDEAFQASLRGGANRFPEWIEAVQTRVKQRVGEKVAAHAVELERKSGTMFAVMQPEFNAISARVQDVANGYVQQSPTYDQVQYANEDEVGRIIAGKAVSDLNAAFQRVLRGADLPRDVGQVTKVSEWSASREPCGGLRGERQQHPPAGAEAGIGAGDHKIRSGGGAPDGDDRQGLTPRRCHRFCRALPIKHQS
jgi:hypothetical protein